jgi:hypothetical protein
MNVDRAQGTFLFLTAKANKVQSFLSDLFTYSPFAPLWLNKNVELY